MEYLIKNNIIILSCLLVMLFALIFINTSTAKYKTRIMVDTINLEIIPYQPVNTVVEEEVIEDATKEELEILEKEENIIE